MKQIDTEDARVIRVSGKSVVFQLADGTEAFASRRVANNILLNKDIPVFLEEL